MAKITGTINGGTPPYSIVVRKVGETTGNRCTSGCNGFPLTFTEDEGNNSYYFRITDSSEEPCVLDSREIGGGMSNVNCTVVQPSYNTQIIPPTCINGVRSNAVLRLTNILNGTRYKVCYNTVSMNCASCSESDGFITGSSLDIILEDPETSGNQGVLLRVYKDEFCTNYKEFFTTITYSTCVSGETPNFAAAVIQPTCSLENGGTVVNAILKLSNISDASRYKICYNSSTFSTECEASCTSSDGVIVGMSSDITIPSPAEGSTQTNTIRVFNGNGCDKYRDYTFSISSPRCSSNETTLAAIDILFSKGSSTCSNNPIPRTVDFDMYFILNTPEMIENNQKSVSRGTLERNIPNGNDVPNVFASASIDLNCISGTGFYRWFFNLSLLRAKYPTVNIFTFDLFAKRTVGTSNPEISVKMSKQKGVAMTRVSSPQLVDCENHAVGAGIINNTDVSRTPCYLGNSTTYETKIYYGTADVGFKKIGTLSFNMSLNTHNWTSF